MGLAKLLSFFRGVRNGANVSDVKLDHGGGANVLSEHFSAPGDDSYPLTGDYVVTVSIQRSGGAAVVGYIDPKNDQKAQAGEKRIYARDANGAMIVELWLKNTGEATLVNANGYSTLRADGTVEANGATIPTDGDVITASGVSLNNHTHAQGNDSANNTQQETQPPTV